LRKKPSEEVIRGQEIKIPVSFFQPFEEAHNKVLHHLKTLSWKDDGYSSNASYIVITTSLIDFLKKCLMCFYAPRYTPYNESIRPSHANILFFSFCPEREQFAMNKG